MQFRIDDIGASSKQFEQYGKSLFSFRGIPYFYWPLANVGFFKRIWPFKSWGPYQELTVDEWRPILGLLSEKGIVPIIGITACWVDEKSRLIPFPEKFSNEAKLLKQAADNGKIIVANHGLTHCLVGQHLPKRWGSNRSSHREFWPNQPQAYHAEHIQRSQEILEGFFNRRIEIFVPPGNVWSVKTYRALLKTNIRLVISRRYMLDSREPMNKIRFHDDHEGYYPLHDRELKLYGPIWLMKCLSHYSD